MAYDATCLILCMECCKVMSQAQSEEHLLAGQRLAEGGHGREGALRCRGPRVSQVHAHGKWAAQLRWRAHLGRQGSGLV